MVLANITVDKIRVENSNLICFYKVTDIEYSSGKHFDSTDSTTQITLGFDKIAGKPKSTN